MLILWEYVKVFVLQKYAVRFKTRDHKAEPCKHGLGQARGCRARAQTQSQEVGGLAFELNPGPVGFLYFKKEKEE